MLLSGLRRQDLNLRPPGHEPDELPTTPLRNIIKTTASKPSNNCLTLLLFSDFSHHANRLLIALYGKNHGSTLHGIKWHCLIFASQPLLTGSEHRAACGRWSGAPSRKKQRALRRAPRPRWLHIARFRLWRKLIHYAPRPLPKMRAFWGAPLQGDYVSDRQGRWFHYTFGAWKNEVASLMKCGQTA